MRSAHSRVVAVILAIGTLAVALDGQSPRTYPRFADVEAILQQFADAVPVELKPFPGLNLESPWAAWIERHDGQIRARLASGDQDTILNWLMYGTTFTRQPRASITNPADEVELARLRGVIGARTDDLIRALQTPGTDERRLFARRFFEGNGFSVTTPAARLELRAHLLQALLRVTIEQEQLAAAFAAARQAGDPIQEIAASQRMYATRGLSLDTALAPNFALERALAELKAKGLLANRPIRRIGIVGAGLDFADKDAGFDAYPIQTVQPFAVMDAVRRLELGPGTDPLDVVALDISPRVIDHISGANRRAARGTSYTITLPLQRDRLWLPEFREYWRAVGERIGSVVAAPPNPAMSGLAEVRSIRLPSALVRSLSAVDLNVVTQRMGGQPFDLIVATNVLVYYDAVDQAMALANIGSMLRDGGWLLSNTILPEVPSVPMEVVALRPTTYTTDGVKDVIVSYRKKSSW